MIESVQEFCKNRGLTEATIDLWKVDWGDETFPVNLRNRIVLPINDVYGRQVAWAGRVLDDSKPKWINSSYEKRKHLFGLDRALEEIIHTRTVIVVEGYFDVVTCHQEGLKNVVGALCTSLSTEQGSLLSRYAEKMIIVLDGDREGGGEAKLPQTFLGSGFSVTMNTSEDPDQFILEHGKQKFLEKIKEQIHKNDPIQKIMKELSNGCNN
jgi:DNA primase